MEARLVVVMVAVLLALGLTHATFVPETFEPPVKIMPHISRVEEVTRTHALVGVTVTNMRTVPGSALSISYEIDHNQLSQASFYESIFILNGTEKDGWVMTEAPMQPQLENGSWGPYRSYMKLSDLYPVAAFPSYNLVVVNNVAEVYERACHLTGCLPSDVKLQVVVSTYLEGISLNYGWWMIRLPFSAKSFGWIRERDVHRIAEQPKGAQLRTALVERSKQLLGWYYFWGGKSAFVKSLYDQKVILTGVDCSGLVGTVYKSHGIILPRDADPQFRKSRNVTEGPSALMAGDLFFFAGKVSRHVTHVMMYVGDDMLVESSVPSFENNSTRIVTLKERFGYDLKDLTWGMTAANGLLVYWGRMLEDSLVN